ncbi:MAG: hypothetical protein J5U17_09070 [Candidatus Methanoperedens sp.]|nr:hypothetical protein [Candidatus Methanoperedens sp.]MCE8427402.1 hypothetical protein [Candidatus Methanoperedens sp.]
MKERLIKQEERQKELESLILKLTRSHDFYDVMEYEKDMEEDDMIDAELDDEDKKGKS